MGHLLDFKIVWYYRIVGDIMNKIMQKFSITLNDFMLNEYTEDVEDFQITEIVNLFKDCYSSKDPGILRATTILNAIFTHRTLTFMVTRRQYNKILNSDVNHTKKNLSGSVYGLFIESLKTNGMLKELREPSTGKAGVYKLIDPDLVKMLKKLHIKEVTEAFDDMMDFDKIQAEKEEKVLAYYDSKEVKPKKNKQQMMDEIEKLMHNEESDE